MQKQGNIDSSSDMISSSLCCN